MSGSNTERSKSTGPLVGVHGVWGEPRTIGILVPLLETNVC